MIVSDALSTNANGCNIRGSDACNRRPPSARSWSELASLPCGSLEGPSRSTCRQMQPPRQPKPQSQYWAAEILKTPNPTVTALLKVRNDRQSTTSPSSDMANQVSFSN